MNRQKNGDKRIGDGVVKYISWLGLICLFFATAAHAGPRTSNNYVITTDTTDSAGGA